MFILRNYCKSILDAVVNIVPQSSHLFWKMWYYCSLLLAIRVIIHTYAKVVLLWPKYPTPFFHLMQSCYLDLRPALTLPPISEIYTRWEKLANPWRNIALFGPLLQLNIMLEQMRSSTYIKINQDVSKLLKVQIYQLWLPWLMNSWELSYLCNNGLFMTRYCPRHTEVEGWLLLFISTI